MDGFYEEVIDAYPDLAAEGFRRCVQGDASGGPTYHHALEDVPKVEERTKHEYSDVKQVLLAAAGKQASLQH